jgi:hypothetical protein
VSPGASIRSRVLLGGLTLLLALASPAASRAQDRAASRALAESLFRDGRRLMQEGSTGEACAKFAESQRLEPALGTLLNLAVCHEQQGKTASAWAEFSAAAALAARNGELERERLARERLAVVGRQLSRLTIEVNHPSPGLELRLDGSLLGAAAWGTAIPVDPGEHRIEVTAPGHESWTEVVAAAPGPATRTVSVPALRATRVPPAPAAMAPRPVRPVPPLAPPAEAMPPRRVAGLVAAGLGIAGVGVGSFFGLRALSEQRTVERECMGHECNENGLRADERAHTAARWSNVGFGVGIVGLGAAAYLLLVSPAGETSRVARWQLVPVGRSGAVLTAGRSW